MQSASTYREGLDSLLDGYQQLGSFLSIGRNAYLLRQEEYWPLQLFIAEIFVVVLQFHGEALPFFQSRSMFGQNFSDTNST